MDNGYRAITEDEGATVKAGDQAKSSLMDWHNISAEDIGKSYHEYDFNHWEYRRPIALDATANAPDEWPSETEKAAMDAATFGTSFMLNGKRVDPKDVFIDVPEADEWDGEVLNLKFGGNATFEKYKMLYRGEFCIVYKSESHVECSGRVDECEFRPIETPAQAEERERKEWIGEAQKHCTEFSSNQIGNIYDWLKSTDQLKDKSDEYSNPASN